MDWRGVFFLNLSKKIKAVKSVVDGIDGIVDVIDDAAVKGLLGTNNSLAYKVHEIEKHFHNWERWFGVALTPNAEINVADTLIQGAVNHLQLMPGTMTGVHGCNY